MCLKENELAQSGCSSTWNNKPPKQAFWTIDLGEENKMNMDRKYWLNIKNVPQKQFILATEHWVKKGQGSEQETQNRVVIVSAEPYHFPQVQREFLAD